MLIKKRIACHETGFFSHLLTDNPKEMTRVSVYIRILDVNDNAPQFAVFYDTFVCENAKTGQVSHLRKCFKLFGFVMGTGTKSFALQ